MLSMLILIIGYVNGNSGDCNNIGTVENCLRPGIFIKDCSCDCLQIEIDRISRSYVQADFASCADFMRSCNFYKLGYELTIFEETHYLPVAISKFWINLTENQSIQRFPLKKSTIETELKTNLSYRFSVQPVCTICEQCRRLKDLVMPPVTFHMSEAVPAFTTENREKDLKSFELVLLVIAISICVVCIAITVIVFYRRHKIQNSNNQHDNSYSSNSLMDNATGGSFRNSFQ